MIKKKETPVHSIRFPNLENEINKVHTCEKNMFFSLLTDEFLDSLNPVY